jgi:hypothetical protein
VPTVGGVEGLEQELRWVASTPRVRPGHRLDAEKPPAGPHLTRGVPRGRWGSAKHYAFLQSFHYAALALVRYLCQYSAMAPRPQVLFRLDEDVLAFIRARALDSGAPMNEVVRRMLRAAMEDQSGWSVG